MQKIIYALWRDPGEDRTMLNGRLLNEIGPTLTRLAGVRAVRLNLQDDAVARAESLRQYATDPQMDATVQLWMDVAHDAFRGEVDALLAAGASRMAAWTVLESTIIPNTLHPARPGERTPGWSQICFLQRPARLDAEQWRTTWQDLHTGVGRDTQSNFEYVQNLVVRPLIAGPAPCAAIVEECFPAAAMDDPRVFFDAVDDEARFDRHTSMMAESCARFIDMPDGIDVLPTSQYDLAMPIG